LQEHLALNRSGTAWYLGTVQSVIPFIGSLSQVTHLRGDAQSPFYRKKKQKQNIKIKYKVLEMANGEWK
jgi:hypothetical protein